MEGTVIRRARKKDIASVTRLDRLCFSLPWSEQTFSQEITGNEFAFYIVAESDGYIVGYAGLWRILEEGHITNIAVHPDYRRKGLGKRLLTELMARTSRQGIARFTLEVRRSNSSAIALYLGMGFLIMGVRPGYYDDNGEDALIMWHIGIS
jgi:ribosomal-protein-alanine N-acetyltransferase